MVQTEEKETPKTFLMTKRDTHTTFMSYRQFSSFYLSMKLYTYFMKQEQQQETVSRNQNKA